ncbi:MAG TPA: Rrf2 family transcriptional regulator [Solirubrobacterales bacterium]|nr:Rrf2 family transcriptional regulator [Solirubrobacterales bacterium]
MFSTRAEYGVRVMVALAREDAKSGQGRSPSSLAQIADANGLPFAYLEHLAARLKKANLIESRRGPRGGYLLAQPAEEISMAQIVEALEGQIAPIECISASGEGDITCVREGESNEICPTKLLWTRVQGSIVRTLRDMTLADLANANERIAAAQAAGSGANAKTSPKLSATPNGSSSKTITSASKKSAASRGAANRKTAAVQPEQAEQAVSAA